MNKQLLLGGFALLLSTSAFAQNHHLTLVGQLPYTDQLSNIWGYQHPDGTEYALVGTDQGTSIVSLADPAAPVEVAFVQGTPSIWRELRTWGDRAYVVSDATNDGILIIDLSNLPNSVTHQFYNPSWTVGATTDVLNAIHTIHIDENGRGYLMGSNLNSGGTLIIDVAGNPTAPALLGYTPAVYAHDSYTRNDTLYTSDIYAGMFSIYDISDPAAPVLLATQTTPFNFTHNAWLSDDSRTLFTTDEKANAYVAAYDISDLSNIRELDRFRPYETEGRGVIPHNAHVQNDYVYVSYYTDGLVVLDGSRPENLVEVGKYDTYPGADGGFFGDWGVYPYLPSGLVLVSDMQTGLHVFQPNLQRACWLEGLVTEQGTGTLLANVHIEMNATAIYTDSEVDGEYRTGTANAGSYDVTFTKAGYIPKTITTNLVNGQVTIENVELEVAPSFTLSGQVLEAGTNAPIENAVVYLKSGLYDLQTTTNASGNFGFTVYEDTYNVLVGAWGYHTQEQSNQLLQTGMAAPTYLLDKGYRDEFALDLGWTVDDAAATGNWERGATPAPVLNGANQNVVPPTDLTDDIGNQCYVTGNHDNGGYAVDDVDNGQTVLYSPNFDLTGYSDPYLHFSYWWVNEGGNGMPNDTLIVNLFNGTTIETVAIYTTTAHAWSATQSFRISDFIQPTAQMMALFAVGDDPATGGHVAEAAIDLFEITDGPISSFQSVAADAPQCRIFPNPFSAQVQVEYAIPAALWSSNQTLRLFNSLGQTLALQTLDSPQGIATLQGDWLPGMYWIEIAGKTYPVVKQ